MPCLAASNRLPTVMKYTATKDSRHLQGQLELYAGQPHRHTNNNNNNNKNVICFLFYLLLAAQVEDPLAAESQTRVGEVAKMIEIPPHPPISQHRH